MRNFVTERLGEYDRTHGEGKGMTEMQRYLSDGGVMRLKYSIKDAVVNLKKQANANQKAEALNNKAPENAPVSDQPVEEKEIILDYETAKERIGNMLEKEINEGVIGEDKQEEIHEENQLTANEKLL